MEKLEAAEFDQFRELIQEKSGLFFDEKKIYFVEKRIFQRIKEGSYSNPRDYYRALKYGNSTEEIQKLVESLTTNETYFYRHIPQLESFVEEALPLVVSEKSKVGNRTISIWSAASSSGEEIYTIAIMLREQLPDFSKWRIELLATDIDRNILDKASKAIYDKRSVKDVPPDVLRKYFTPINSELFQLNPLITSMVKFKRINLIDRKQMDDQSNMDFIFCRNVLIYFDEPGRRQVVHSLYNALNKNGFIFLGHSESVGRLSAAFKLVKFKKSLSYQK